MLSMLNDRKTSSTVLSQIGVNCLEASASFMYMFNLGFYFHYHSCCGPFKAVGINVIILYSFSVGAVSWHSHTSTMPAYSSHGQLITYTSPLLLAQSMAILQPALSVFLSVCNYLATLSLHIYLVELGQA